MSQSIDSSSTQRQLQKRVTAFLAKCEAISRQHQADKTVRNLTIDQLIRLTPSLPKELLDRHFKTDLYRAKPTEVFSDVRGSLHNIREILNGLSKTKRFYILETIDFFNNSIFINKILPALFDTEGADSRNEIIEFVYQTFKTLNKNVETIVSSPTLIKEGAIHIERGSLYSFSSEVARLILRYFEQEFVRKNTESSSDVANVVELFSKPANILEKGLIRDNSLFRKLSLSFVLSMQTHDFLPLYAQKRHEYYKLFLKNIIQKSKTLELEEIQTSQILTGCLLRNGQLLPTERLIKHLSSENHFSSLQTAEEYDAFVDLLAPSTVVSVIDDFKRSVRTVIKPESEKKEVKTGGPLLRKILKPDFIRRKIKQSFKT